ncbi:PAS-domain containing protein [Qipengyuania aurantiaca]|uniref:histidine kinase n=1 Tax=Qipengyuania aurantiaca TaxID=2867233 RepID=A0ABX8ZTR8_9SPHN|nr:ATP-binding protein [Qipengyuania aurantiaca]QZD90982.1 PAS-domain containing protein [Qipengyuania aurantiaca]
MSGHANWEKSIFDPVVLGALSEGLIVLDAQKRVLGASQRAIDLLWQPAGVPDFTGEAIDGLIDRMIESGFIVLPDGVEQEEYRQLMIAGIENDTKNIRVGRRDDIPLRVSCTKLPDDRTVIGIVEHVTKLLEPVATGTATSKFSGRLPVVVAREGFDVPPQLAEALEYLEEGFALYDADDRFVLCNRKFCELLFVDPDARPRPGELMDDIVLRAGRTNASAGKPEGMTIEEYAAASTASFKALTKGQHYELDDGKIMEVSGYRTANGGSLFTTLDVTQREEAALEAERQRLIAHQNEKLSALGELLAGVAHELNNPLSIVVGFSQMLEGQLQDPQQLRRIGKIRTAAERSARIVKTFLAMARQRPARIELVDPREIIESAEEIAAYGFRADGGKVIFDLQPGLSAVSVDKDQLIQVVANLIVNAEQAMKGLPGPLTMTLSARQVAGTIELVVSDNGPGMSAETQRRIFEPFFTTKDVGEGTGFGLAFCHRIVTAHNGSIKVVSKAGIGSSFILALPKANHSAVAQRASSARSSHPPMKLLVVDDERDVADLIVEMLSERGHDAQAVYGPFDGIRIAQSETFDAIISDLKMPGMTGDKMMQHIVDTRPQLAGRFGFVTGDSLSARVHEFLADDAYPYIEKPIAADELDGLVARLGRKARS